MSGDGQDDVVWICAHVEAMAERDEYLSVPRAEWEAMTPEQQDDLLTSTALEAMQNAGGCGASVVDVDDVPARERGGQ